MCCRLKIERSPCCMRSRVFSSHSAYINRISFIDSMHRISSPSTQLFATSLGMIHSLRCILSREVRSAVYRWMNGFVLLLSSTLIESFGLELPRNWIDYENVLMCSRDGFIPTGCLMDHLL